MGLHDKSEIAGIDYLRLGAAALVILYHFFFINRLSQGDFHFDALLYEHKAATPFHFGWIGVELFFVISGYVISFSAEKRTSASFLRGRALRLIPGVWICATIDLCILSIMSSSLRVNLFEEWIRTIIFWPRGQINDVYWTLQIEISFYLIILIMMKCNIHRFIESVIFTTGLCSGIFWFTTLLMQGHIHEVLIAKGNGIVLRSMLLTHGCFFAVGVSLFRGFSDRFTAVRTVGIVVLLICCLTEITAHNSWLADTVDIPLSPWPALLIFVAGVSAVYGSILWNEIIADALGNRGLWITRIAGRATYPLYLVHKAVGAITVLLVGRGMGVFAIVLAIILAFVSALFIERFPERWLRHVLSETLRKKKSFRSNALIQRVD